MRSTSAQAPGEPVVIFRCHVCQRTSPDDIAVGDVIRWSAGGEVYEGTVTKLGRDRHVHVDSTQVTIPPNWILGKVTTSRAASVIGTWCEGCGPHENLGVCSECGYPIEVGFVISDEVAERISRRLNPDAWTVIATFSAPKREEYAQSMRAAARDALAEALGQIHPPEGDHGRS